MNRYYEIEHQATKWFYYLVLPAVIFLLMGKKIYLVFAIFAAACYIIAVVSKKLGDQLNGDKG